MRALILSGFSAIYLVICPPSFAEEQLHVSRSLQLSKPAAEVWQKIGGLCAFKDWYTAIADCTIFDKDGVTYRTIVLPGDIKIEQKLTEKRAMGYSYDVLSSPLPVKNYSARFDVSGDTKSATIRWSAVFDAKGTSDDQAKKIMSDIFDDGLKVLKESLTK